jgi:hypothetical protein
MNPQKLRAIGDGQTQVLLVLTAFDGLVEGDQVGHTLRQQRSLVEDAFGGKRQPLGHPDEARVGKTQQPRLPARARRLKGRQLPCSPVPPDRSGSWLTRGRDNTELVLATPG